MAESVPATPTGLERDEHIPTTQEGRPIHRQHYFSTTAWSAIATTRRRWSRRMLVAVAAFGLGLLPGIPSLAPAGSGVVQAAQPDQPHAPAGGLAGAVQSADHGPTHDMLDGAVVSSGAPDERVDVRAALDQGRRLFSLEARYHDGDYKVAGPAGVSRQPLAEVFAPLEVWLAAPGHEHEMLWLWLQTDPRSANPGRFDAACQAFTTALGPYLLKASDLPAGKAWGELTSAELAALLSRPRVLADWSTCTGEQQPTAARKAAAVAAPATPATNYDHWMADMSDAIGPRLLKQVVIPGSHDAGTYEFGGAPGPYAQAQDEDITAQLYDGSRYLDIRAGYADPNDNGDWDFWTVHGPVFSRNVRLSQMLQEVLDWANQPAHYWEIIVLSVSADSSTDHPESAGRLSEICSDFVSSATSGLLQPGIVPGGDISALSLNDIWSLPAGGSKIIINWSPGGQGIGCPNLPTPSGAFYANQCEADSYFGAASGWTYGNMPGIETTLAGALTDRKDWKGNPGDPPWTSKLPNPLPNLPNNVVSGLYLLDLQPTPNADCLNILDSTKFDTAEKGTHTWLLNSYLNDDYFAQQNLNIIVGDFVESRGIVDLAIKLNRLMGAPGARVQAPGDSALYLIDSDGMPVRTDYFPNGNYQLAATCASSDTPPFAASSLTLSSSQIPTGGTVAAEITGCSAQGGNAYACALQVTLGPPLAANTVFHVGIGGGGFASTGVADRPQVTASPGCDGPPLPSPYLADGNGSYTRYDVNIDIGGCTAGAVVTFGEAVTGAAGATITQPVTVPGFGAGKATFMLPPLP